MDARMRLAAKSALALGSALISLAVLEAALRVFSIVPDDIVRMHYEPRRSVLRAVEGLSHGYRPGRYSQVFSLCRGSACRSDKAVDFSINSAGLRDVEHVRRKPAGTFRILVLGDSFTVGYGVALEHSYPKRLEVMLNGRYRGRPRFEVINAAVEAYTTYDELSYLERYGLAYEPDCVVVGFYLNDLALRMTHQRSSGPDSQDFASRASRYEPDKWANNLAATTHYGQRFYLMRWLAAARRGRLTRYKTIGWYRFLWASANKLGQREFIAALQGLARVQRTRSLPVLVLVFPKLAWLDGKYPFSKIHKRVERLCLKNGLASEDLLGFLVGRRPSSLWAHPTDQHPNPWTHQLAASVILERLVADPRFGLPAVRR